MNKKMRKEKKCSCGRIFREIPKNAIEAGKDSYPGFYWNCTCGSTLYYPSGLMHVSVITAKIMAGLKGRKR